MTTTITTALHGGWTRDFVAWLASTGQTRAAWARKLGVAPSVLLRWTRGAMPRLEMRRRIEAYSRGLVRA